MKNKKILITGASGFIGRYLTKSLLEKNYELVLTYCDGKIDREFKNYSTQVKIDLTEERDLKKIPPRLMAVFHLAAYVPLRDSHDLLKHTLNVNSQGTLNLLRRCCDIGTKQLINASSVSVYGNGGHGKVSEKCVLMPDTFYGISKMLGEMYCHKFTSMGKISAISLRYSSIYGAGQFPDTVLPTFIRNVRKGKTIEIYGEGKKTQDFIYIKDVVEANLLALQSKETGSFNIASGKGVNITSLANKISNIFSEEKVKIIFNPKKNEENTDCYYNVSKAKNKFGYKINYPLMKGLMDYKKTDKIIS